jgi:hypothetical protein
MAIRPNLLDFNPEVRARLPRLQKPNQYPMSIDARINSGGILSIDEFCHWASICRVTAYKEVKDGRLRLTKIGRRSGIAADDALIWRDLCRSNSNPNCWLSAADEPLVDRLFRHQCSSSS